ncbi:bifunctional Protein phosphatase 2C family/PPM-type phosphatase domain/PPM-type phosphatase domain superfamily [Babesia duncani]|uniref:protein-serine/threonine phosphatase n=1 Tax=Babesia duncani TaxID=323732 RepID=A0AAD9PLT8_9APIC|nr:bifunctional Protein phosphatase 2C family/PPM-type phosphatase domain/PPM-type phosphatase domain superfamily [Babesia duncani]
MEDEYCLCDSLRNLVPALPPEFDFAVCALFDGHGGKSVAVLARDILTFEIGSQLVNVIEEHSQLGDEKSFDFIFKRAVNVAFERFDSRIASELPGCNDGCTALLVFIGNGRIYTVNLGDSAAYLCRKIDNVIHAIPLNELHTPWLPSEKDRILSYGGTVEEGRVNGVLEVTRSFGDLHLKRFGVSCKGSFRQATLDFDLDEFVLMACDGFWGAIDAHEACRKTGDLIKKVKCPKHWNLVGGAKSCN